MRNTPTSIQQLAAVVALACLATSCGTLTPTAGPGYSHILLAARYEPAHWGIHVEDQKTGEVIISLNGQRLFAPASNTKLFSVAAALEEFGADHRFVTSIYRTGQVDSEAVLHGDLILRPTGDLTLGGRDNGNGGIQYSNSDHIYARNNPKTQLTTADPVAGLRVLAAKVKAAGIRTVADVLIDDRLFAPTDSTGSGPRTVSPILVNDNLVDFVIRPTGKGALAQVDYRPVTERYRVGSKIVTTQEGAYGVRIDSPKPGFFVLSGTIPHGHPPQVEVHEVHEPADNARALLIEALQDAGVAVQASEVESNRVDNLPASCEGLPEVASLVSAKFAEEARLILKVSHNLHASALPLLVAARHGKRTLGDGLRIQGDLLRQLGVDTSKISFGGAAGGSRSDMTTPEVTVQLLRAVARRPYYAAFRRALPILGVDGTLASVAADTEARGKVQAKTGSYWVHDAMNNRKLLTSKALAGYMTTRSGRQLAFSIVVNNVPASERATATTLGADLGAICAAIQSSY